MIHDTRPVTADAVTANPELEGKTPLQVYDAVVRALTDAGLAVILNNHTNTTRWCCGVDGNERWNASRSDETWENDWLFMACRYRDNPRVVGADLYNEVRRSVWDDPNWGLGDRHDWFAASQRAGDRILTEANPDLLIIVEGINWTGLPVDGLRTDAPPSNPYATCPTPSSTPANSSTPPTSTATPAPPHRRDRHRRDQRPPLPGPHPAELADVLDRQAFYVAGDVGRHYTAPCGSPSSASADEETGAAPRAWFENFVGQLVRADADFAYWPSSDGTRTAAATAGPSSTGTPRAGAWPSTTATTGVRTPGDASSRPPPARATSRR